MSKIKVVDGYQKKVVTQEQVRLYRPFGWEFEKNSREYIKKQAMYTVMRKKDMAQNKKLATTEKKYLKLEKRICKKKAGFLSVLCFLCSLLLLCMPLLPLKTDGVEWLKPVAEYLPYLFMGVGVLGVSVSLCCPSGKPKYGKYKKAKQNKLYPQMSALVQSATEIVYGMKTENKSFMNGHDGKNYEMQTIIKRAVREIEDEDE